MNILSKELNGGSLSHWKKIDVIRHLEEKWDMPTRTAQRWIYGETKLKNQSLKIAKIVIAELQAESQTMMSRNK